MRLQQTAEVTCLSNAHTQPRRYIYLAARTNALVLAYFYIFGKQS